MTSICDERGQELIYAGMPITEVFKSEIGLGGTLGLLWFQRRCVCSFNERLTIKISSLLERNILFRKLQF